MLTTSLILPHPALSDFIYNYAVCQLHESINLTYPSFANHETTLGFFLGDSPILLKDSKPEGERKSISKICLFGLVTEFAGNVQFKGRCDTFLIEFKPNGFNKLFRIPASKICNTNYPATEIIGREVAHLYEQLGNATSLEEKVHFADNYLLDIINRQDAAYINDGITKISQQLLSNSYSGNISEYAYKANMSIRNFERRFSEQVGISPKLFCRLLRFSKAFKAKISFPEMNWLDIAYESGYYDTMHLIKEFKQFANASPAMLFHENPDFMEVGFETLERTNIGKTH